MKLWRRIRGPLGKTLLAGFLAFLIWFVTWTDWRFVRAVPGFFAKEVCSCLFVVGQEEEFCFAYGKQIFELSERRIDRDKKQVWARLWWLEASATWQSPRQGCRMDVPQGS